MFHFSLFLSLLDVSERDTALKGVCKVPKPCLQNYRYQQVTGAGLFMTFQNKPLPYLSRNAVGFILLNCNHLRVHL